MTTRRFRLLSALVTVGVVMAFIFGAIISPIVSAKIDMTPQGEADRFKNVGTWYLYFKVTIDGEMINENSMADPGNWSVHNSYSGSVALNTRQPFVKTDKNTNSRQTSRQDQMAAAMAMMKQMNGSFQWTVLPSGVQRMGPFNGLVPLYVKRHEMTKYGGKDACNDDEFTTNTREGDGDDFSYAAPFFMADTQHLTYNVTIPLKPDGDKQQVMVKQEVQSKVNKQWKTETTPPGPHKVPFKEMEVFKLSNVKVTDPKRGGSLLKGGIIHHEIDVPLDVVSSYVEFDSGDVEPDDPILSGNSDTKDKVKVHIYYKLSKTPINTK